MKFIKVSATILALAIIGCFAVKTAGAQSPDLNIWEGKWFKISVSVSSYCLEHGSLQNDSAKFTGYLKIWNWDPDQKILQGDFYNDKDGWEITPFNLHYFAGTNLNFLYWVEETISNFTLGGTGRITGKMNGGVLKSAKLTMPGGYHRDFSFDPGFPWYCAGGVKISGALVSAVPVPPGMIIH